MCVPNLEFQLLNPTTQVALFSMCADNCTAIENITWNIYQGYQNGSSTMIEWIQFNQVNTYQNIWFFGKHFVFLLLLKYIFLVDYYNR
jgi:hypothetical protein